MSCKISDLYNLHYLSTTTGDIATGSYLIKRWLASFDSQRPGESNSVCPILIRGGRLPSSRLPSKPGPILHKSTTNSHPIEAWLVAFDSRRQGESNCVCPVVIRGG